MVCAQRLWIKLQRLFRRNRSAHRLDDEIQFHLDHQIAENIAAGMSREEARYAAMRTFGNPTYLKEETRDTWGWICLEQIHQDLRYGLRMLSKNSGFTVVATLTLALGIGATTAIFSVIYGVLISPYPYAKPQEIWVPGLRNSQANQRMRPYRQSEFLELAKLPAFSDVMATGPENMLLTGDFAPE